MRLSPFSVALATFCCFTLLGGFAGWLLVYLDARKYLEHARAAHEVGDAAVPMFLLGIPAGLLTGALVGALAAAVAALLTEVIGDRRPD